MIEHLILNGRLEAAYLYHETAPRNFKEELLALFSKGKRPEFLKLFHLLKTEEKLQFYVRVYFLIYSIHPALKAKPAIPEEQIAAFREYLDTKGADLAKTNEFLQFYALSYVKKPLEHPSYKTLFKKEWVSNLTDKLQTFLNNQQRRMKEVVLREDSDRKKLRSPEFVQYPEATSSAHIKTLEQKNKNLFQEVQVFKRRYAQLQKNNQALLQAFNTHLMESQNKWFQITRELTNNSKTLVQMIARSNSSLIHDRRYQRIKKRTEKFQKIVKKELDQLLNQSQDLSVFDKPSNNEASYSAYSASATPNLSQRNITTFVSIDEYVPTNYVGLIRDFKKMGDPQKISVLQGLSWRIIKSKSKWIRRQTIVGLIVNDVLGLVNGDVQYLLFNKNLMGHVVKLFLFISEDSYGRAVLFGNGGLYKQLIDLIPEIINNKDFNCLDMVLQILLNIWHNKQIFKELINLNIIDMCISVLLQTPQVVANDDILEEIATLLLNATATDEGLDSFEYQVDVFYYLCQAFKEANDTNRNLIGAIIYALLGRKNLWKLAHEAKLPYFIDDLIRIDERSNKQQLKLIQAKLHSFEPGKTMDTNDFQEQQSDSNLEEQNYERNEDELVDLEEYIKGHDMLSAKYPLKQKEAEKQIQEINKIMNQDKTVVQVPLDQPRKPQPQPNIEKKDEKKKFASVRLPQIHKKKEGIDLDQPKPKAKNTQGKEYYSYKSPNFKNIQQRNINSMQVQSIEHSREISNQKYRVTSFQYDKDEQRRRNRIQTTKPQEKSKENDKKDDFKNKLDKKSIEKQEYRIKKSTSVQKGLGNPYRKELINQAQKNVLNFAEYRSPESLKSPPPKKSKEEVLRQLNQQLRAQKKAGENERKLSAKNIPANPNLPHRENSHLKKNNYVGGQEELRAFQSKPKIRRTPPKEDE